MLERQARDGLVVDLAGRRIEPVLHRVEKLAREIDLGAVRQVPAMVEAHAEERLARLEQREIDRGIRLRAGMRLHVGVGGAEELFGTVDGELFHDIDVLAAAVIALARIALGVLVREDRALGFQHPGTGVIFRGDQFEVLFLAQAFGADRSGEFGVE